MAPGVIFTAVHFLHYLQMGEYARTFHNNRQARLASDKHSSFLGPFLSNEENIKNCENSRSSRIHNTSFTL
jgi:hypothetical protein